MVYGTSSLSRAVRILERNPPHLVILDFGIPLQEALIFYEAVQEEPVWKSIPLLLITSGSSLLTIKLNRQLEHVKQIKKPFQMNCLVNSVKSALFDSLQHQVSELQGHYLSTIYRLADSIENRDPLTKGHLNRMSHYAFHFSKALNWPSSYLKTVLLGAFLHDIGKISVPRTVLNKSSHLSHAEWSMIKRHPLEGAHFIQRTHQMKNILPFILYHHEHWDGSGYPYGLEGNRIPVQGRFLAIADTYDALTNSRPYHKAADHQEAREVLSQNAGKQLDPDLVPIFLKTIEKHPLAS